LKGLAQTEQRAQKQEEAQPPRPALAQDGVGRQRHPMLRIGQEWKLLDDHVVPYLALGHLKRRHERRLTGLTGVSPDETLANGDQFHLAHQHTFLCTRHIPSSTSCHQSTFVGVAIVVRHNRLNLGIRRIALPNLAKASFRSLRLHSRIEHAARASPQSVEAARIPHREDRVDGRTIYRWEVLMP